MPTRRNTAIILFVFVGLLSSMVLLGCSQRHQTVYTQPTASSTTTVTPTTHIIRQNERDYYVDSRGALHMIVRRDTTPTGGLYYIEGDERGYLLDPSGRLYYREPAGTVLYYEDLSPGRPIEAIEAPRQRTYEPGGSRAVDTYETRTYDTAPSRSYETVPARSVESCESQYRECVSGCNSISPRQRYDRPNCMSNCEAIRSGCLGGR